MVETKRDIPFKRMTGWNDWAIHGGMFAAGGAFFLISGIISLCAGQMGINLLGILLGGCFLWFGGSSLAFFFQTVHICDSEIRLMLGPLVLQRLPLSLISSVFSASLYLNKGAQRRSVIVLSTADPEYLRRWTDLSDYLSEKTPFGGHFPIRCGLWLEYTPERMDALRRALPGAELIC